MYPYPPPYWPVMPVPRSRVASARGGARWCAGGVMVWVVYGVGSGYGSLLGPRSGDGSLLGPRFGIRAKYP